MLILLCPRCQATATVACSCPPGRDRGALGHEESCQLAGFSWDSAVTCAPGSGCCQEPHNHAENAASCPEGHDGQPCPEPEKCQVFPGTEGCPGGHCGYGVSGCTSCRPLVIILPSGSAVIEPVTAGAGA
jgi:hypothetical protein